VVFFAGCGETWLRDTWTRVAMCGECAQHQLTALKPMSHASFTSPTSIFLQMSRNRQSCDLTSLPIHEATTSFDTMT